MVADLRRGHRRSDRHRPPHFATTAEHGRPTGFQPRCLASGLGVHAGSDRRRIVSGRVLTKQSKLRDTGLLGGEALVDGLIVSEVLKAATGRQRPLEGDGGEHFFHGSDGFPSGHTLESFALASVIAHQYHDNKAIVVLAYGLATLVGALAFQRPAAFRIGHCGRRSALAGLSAGMCSRGGRAAGDRRPRGGSSPQVIPQVQPSDHSYGVLLAWHPVSE